MSCGVVVLVPLDLWHLKVKLSLALTGIREHIHVIFRFTPLTVRVVSFKSYKKQNNQTCLLFTGLKNHLWKGFIGRNGLF